MITYRVGGKMANYNVTITNGTGSQAMKKGTYTVSATANGYDASTLNPTEFTATETAGVGNFTLTANGTLTFNVNETGAAGGTPVTSGTMIMTDATGTVEYGQAVNISANGDAVFANVPYGTDGEPFQLYFKQLTTDDNHNVFEGVISVSMTAQTQTEYVQNNPTATQTFNLTDATYGLPISGTLTFTENA